MKLQANQLSTHLKKNLAPCYLVTGDEHLLVDEALDRIRAAARDQGFTAREVHVADSHFDWASLISAGANLSLFAERRIVEVRLPTGKPGRVGGPALSQFAGTLGPDLMLIVRSPKLDKQASSTKWVKSLDATGVHMPIWPIGVRELPAWIADRMRRAGLQPQREAVTMIADRVEGNLLAANQEIEKLRLLLGEGPVSAEDVSKAVADSSRFDVYKLADAALEGNARRALKILAGLEAEGVSAVFVIWALTRELRALSMIADQLSGGTDLSAAMRAANVWQSRESFVRSCIRRHSAADLRRLLKAAGQADAMAKGQAYGNAWQLCADIILRLAAPGRKAA
ncbi:MAG: DNA polymerase III subunit delta [Gammaproteobacteria bacterium]|nr:DNA polymerase III subunit delta [Gammaproteobacteria bacterium]